MPDLSSLFLPGLVIMRTSDGEFLYFNGTCWTTEPMPPLDAPF
jgi:hypothetical protein